MPQKTVTVTFYVAWWVRPYIWLAKLNLMLGVPVDFATMARMIAKGVRTTVSR